MSKYNIDTTNQVKIEYVNIRMLVSIANELAEANRLKRIELETIHTTDHSGWGGAKVDHLSVSQKDLEDQA